MSYIKNLKKLSFLVYGLGLTGRSVVNFFKKKGFSNYHVWDDYNKNLFKNKRPSNLNKTLKEVDYIVLSPGISLKTFRNKKLKKYSNKILSDIDLVFLSKKNFKSIIVTGTNGKSTTCKIIEHLLKKNKFKTLLGGNIGRPILDLKIKKNFFLIVEASSFQLAHSKYICPDYALLLNITNDHLDWHVSMKNYIDSKFKIFNLQKKNQYSFVNNKFISVFKKKNLSGKLITPNLRDYIKLKTQIKNTYINSSINDNNMCNVFTLAKLLKIKKKNFLKSINSFKGMPHRFEFFLKKKNNIFINDSKATTFESTKLALTNSKNIYWIVGGLPKKNDKILLKNLKKNIIKSYIIGKNINFFKNQIKNKIDYFVAKNLKNAIIKIFKDIALANKRNNTILLSPSAASYDQYSNFEKRGDEFKRLIKYYAGKSK